MRWTAQLTSHLAADALHNEIVLCIGLQLLGILEDLLLGASD